MEETDLNQTQNQPRNEQDSPIPVSQEGASIESPKNNNLVKIILLVLLVVLVGYLGVDAYQKYQNRHMPILPLQETEAPVTTPVVDDMTDWKTYKDEKYGFEFKYPNDFNLVTKDGFDTLVSPSGTQEIQIAVLDVTGFGYCYTYSNKREISLDNEIAETADGIGGTEYCKDEPIDYSNLGNTYVLIPLEEISVENAPLTQIFISYDYPLNEKTIAKSNFDQILSTFKFTDSGTGVDNPVTWKTYNNADPSFEFMYPSDWEVTKQVDNDSAMWAIKIKPIATDNVTLYINTDGFFAFGWQQETTTPLSFKFLNSNVNTEEYYSGVYTDVGPLKIFTYRFMMNSKQYQVQYSTGSLLTNGSSIEEYENYKPTALKILESFKFIDL